MSGKDKNETNIASAENNSRLSSDRPKKIRTIDPPTTLEEWMQRNNLKVWPKSRRAENTLGIDKEEIVNILGNPSEIKVDLASSARILKSNL